MPLIRFIDIAVFAFGLSAMVIGVGMKDIGWALVVAGGVLMTLVIASRFGATKQ